MKITRRGQHELGLSVLHLIGSFDQGGSEHQAVQLASLQLQNGRNNVHIACLDRRGPLLNEAMRLFSGDIPSYALTSFYNYKTVIQLLRFARLLRERKIDILQTHDFYTNIFGMLAGALARVPVRIAARRETLGFRTAMQKRVERAVYRLAHAVVANSEAVKQQLIAEGVRANRVITIYNGLDLRRVTPTKDLRRDEVLAFFDLPRDINRCFVTLVANMRHPVKDHPTFLRAAQRVKKALPQASFIVAGEGELTDKLRALAADLGIASDTFFIGRCERIAELLAVSDVCVLSSTAEGFSNSILEYMAAARPVVATDVGGAREAVVDAKTGFLVPAGNDESMAERVTLLLGDREQARAMGAHGRQIVEERFSCEAQLERTHTLYNQLIAQTGVLHQTPGAVQRKESKTKESDPQTALEGKGRIKKSSERNMDAGAASTPRAPLRVLVIAPSLGILGGQSRQAKRLLSGLREEPSLDVSFLPIDPPLPKPFRWLQRIRYARTLVQTTTLYWATLLVRVSAHDIVHIFSAAYYSYLISALPAILIAKLYGKKIILNYRSGEAEDHLQNWRVTAIPTMRMADKIVVPSGYLVNVFARFGLQAQAIHNIVELDRFHFRDRSPLRPVFLTTRLLEPLYNVSCVLRAFGLIQQRYPDASLTVGGDGWMRPQLEKFARSLNLQNVTFVGRIPFEEMPNAYDSADIYLTATDIDNMPASITECMSSGLPVVTTDAGGIPYIVKHEESCLMVKRGDYRALAASAIRLLEDDELASRIASTALEACKKFTWKRVRDEWLSLYLELSSQDVKPKNDVMLGSEDAVTQR